MDKRATSTAPVTPAPAPAPADDALLEEAEHDQLIEDDLLVEDVSIDGMCGVY
jgi:mycofactocin precursor